MTSGQFPGTGGFPSGAGIGHPMIRRAVGSVPSASLGTAWRQRYPRPAVPGQRRLGWQRRGQRRLGRRRQALPPQVRPSPDLWSGRRRRRHTPPVSTRLVADPITTYPGEPDRRNWTTTLRRQRRSVAARCDTRRPRHNRRHHGSAGHRHRRRHLAGGHDSRERKAENYADGPPTSTVTVTESVTTTAATTVTAKPSAFGTAVLRIRFRRIKRHVTDARLVRAVRLFTSYDSASNPRGAGRCGGHLGEEFGQGGGTSSPSASTRAPVPAKRAMSPIRRAS